MDKTGLLKAIFDSATDYAIFTLDNFGKITTWNAGAKLIMGYSEDEITGKSGSIIFTPEDRAQGAPQQEFETARITGRAADYRWHVRKDGSLFWADGVMTPIRDATGTQIGNLKILRDATEKKRIEAEILHLTNFDALTGLENRSSFDKRLSEMAAAVLRSDQMLILQLIDLDYFKQVNDNLGHHAGDILLKEAAQRMRSVIRKSDFIARIGGDEFAILQPNVHLAQAGGSLASKLLEALSQPYQIAGHEVFSGASIGVAVFPQDAKEPEQLLKKADLALYKVKNGGRGGFSYFTVHLDAEAHKKNRDLMALKRSVEQHAFRLEYHPKVDSKSGRAIALEALLRCTNPVLSSYPIEEVISLATDAGLMPKISEMVLSEACAQARKWQDAGLSHIRICVNLCSRDLMDPGMPQQINAILNRSNLRAGDLELEITERQLFDAHGQGDRILKDLRSRGIAIALDDFGTGYSSLSYLRHLPVNSLKLDQTFLQMIPQDPQSCAIARAIISLAHTLNIEVIAEGVESTEQADFLRRENCDAMQGFFFTKPLPPAEMTTWLLNWQQTCAATSQPLSAS